MCDEDEIPGCTDASANNFDPAATDDDASCSGCTIPFADNYYAGADIDDGTCIISGCTDAEACNYWNDANNDDGSCSYPVDEYGFDYVDCDGNCLNDLDGDGICNEDEDLDEVLDIINDESAMSSTPPFPSLPTSFCGGGGSVSRRL